jgi:hypothetical protein
MTKSKISQSSVKNKSQEEQKSNSVLGKGRNFDIIAVVGVILAFISVCVAILTCLITISVPEARKFFGLKDDPTSIEVVIPTEIIQPTPTNGACVDVLDVRFTSAPIFSKEGLPESEPVLPSGEYMIIATEYKNLQTQPMSIYWDKVFEVAGQHDTTSRDFTYYVPNWSVTWDYAYDNNLGENCPADLNPGLWNRCYMVFDIDPAIENLYLILYNLQTADGKPFNNSCKTSWKIPLENR